MSYRVLTSAISPITSNAVLRALGVRYGADIVFQGPLTVSDVIPYTRQYSPQECIQNEGQLFNSAKFNNDGILLKVSELKSTRAVCQNLIKYDRIPKEIQLDCTIDTNSQDSSPSSIASHLLGVAHELVEHAEIVRQELGQSSLSGVKIGIRLPQHGVRLGEEDAGMLASQMISISGRADYVVLKPFFNNRSISYLENIISRTSTILTRFDEPLSSDVILKAAPLIRSHFVSSPSLRSSLIRALRSFTATASDTKPLLSYHEGRNTYATSQNYASSSEFNSILDVLVSSEVQFDQYLIDLLYDSYSTCEHYSIYGSNSTKGDIKSTLPIQEEVFRSLVSLSQIDRTPLPKVILTLPGSEHGIVNTLDFIQRAADTVQKQKSSDIVKLIGSKFGSKRVEACTLDIEGFEVPVTWNASDLHSLRNIRSFITTINRPKIEEVVRSRGISHLGNEIGFLLDDGVESESNSQIKFPWELSNMEYASTPVEDADIPLEKITSRIRADDFSAKISNIELVKQIIQLIAGYRNTFSKAPEKSLESVFDAYTLLTNVFLLHGFAEKAYSKHYQKLFAQENTHDKPISSTKIPYEISDVLFTMCCHFEASKGESESVPELTSNVLQLLGSMRSESLQDIRRDLQRYEHAEIHYTILKEPLIIRKTILKWPWMET